MSSWLEVAMPPGTANLTHGWLMA